MTTQIRLHGSKSRRFEDLKAEMRATLGYEPSNSEAVGVLMAAYTQPPVGPSEGR